MTIRQLTDRMNRELKIPFHVDVNHLEDLGLHERTPLKLPSSRDTVAQVVRSAFSPHGLGWKIDHDMIVVVQKDNAELIGFFPVERLRPRDWSEFTNKELPKIDPDSWAEVGGATSWGSSIVVFQNEKNMELVERLLRSQEVQSAGR